MTSIRCLSVIHGSLPERSRRACLGIAAVTICGLPAAALAHHAFSTEFDESLEGEVDGVVTKVWWANPHIRYDVDVTLEDGTVEQWSLHPPGNLPTYRRQNWTAETLAAGDHVHATGNLGRGGAKKLYATCIHLDSGRDLGECVASFTTSEVTADPDRVHTYTAAEFPVDITGFWDNRYLFQRTVDDFQPKPMPMTPGTAALYAGRRYGDDSALRCLPVGLPRIFGSPYPVEVLNAGSH